MRRLATATATDYESDEGQVEECGEDARQEPLDGKHEHVAALSAERRERAEREGHDTAVHGEH